MKGRIISAAFICMFSVALAFGEQPQPAASDGKEAPQFSMGYLYQGSQGTFGGNHIGLNGGRADVALPLKRNFSMVGEFSGVHTGGMSGSGAGLTLLTYMAGPRFSMAMHRRREAGKIVPFAQLLFGGVHASEGLFPNGSSVSSTANSFAMSLGGGLQVGVNQRLSLRVIQAEYLYTRLPNLFDNHQNSYRIGAGIVVRFH